MTDPIILPDAATDPEAYAAALLRTLGDPDPLAVYEQGRLPGGQPYLYQLDEPEVPPGQDRSSDLAYFNEG